MERGRPPARRAAGPRRSPTGRAGLTDGPDGPIMQARASLGQPIRAKPRRAAPRPPVKRLPALLNGIDRLNARLGAAIAWCAVGMVLITAAIVVLRYGFSLGSIAAQESVNYLHAMLITLGAAYTLECGGHVRVDFLYQRMSPRRRAWVELGGGIVLLLPFCACLIYFGGAYALRSWAVWEDSPQPNGMPGVFLVKSLIPAMGALLLAQGMADTLRRGLWLAGIQGGSPPPPSNDA